MFMCFTTLHQDNYKTSGGKASLKFHSIHTDYERRATVKGNWEKKTWYLKKKKNLQI